MVEGVSAWVKNEGVRPTPTCTLPKTALTMSPLAKLRTDAMHATDLSKLSYAEWSLVKIGRGVLHTARMLFWFALLPTNFPVIMWLRSGVWPDLSVFNALSWAFPTRFINWLNYPKNSVRSTHDRGVVRVELSALYFHVAPSRCVVCQWNFDFGVAV